MNRNPQQKTHEEMPLKLNQVLAIENGTKTRTQKDLTEAHHALQKTELLKGLARTYKPLDDEGEKLPDESNRVQMTADEMLKKTAAIMTELLDITATKDWGNAIARADVVIDGRTLIEGAPVPYLLFLDKRLQDLETFVAKIPTLDPSEFWEHDPGQNCWRSKPAQTVKTKKILRNHVKAEATQHHAAQVDVFSEDKVIGQWTTIKYSGALAAENASAIIARIRALRQAVKIARESANNVEVERQRVGARLFAYLLDTKELA